MTSSCKEILNETKSEEVWIEHYVNGKCVEYEGGRVILQKNQKAKSHIVCHQERRRWYAVILGKREEKKTLFVANTLKCLFDVQELIQSNKSNQILNKWCSDYLTILWVIIGNSVAWRMAKVHILNKPISWIRVDWKCLSHDKWKMIFLLKCCDEHQEEIEQNVEFFILLSLDEWCHSNG